MLKHDGDYICSDYSGDRKTVEVDVQYFRSSAHFTTATIYNSTTILTCTCYANPYCKTVSNLIIRIRDGREYKTNTTSTGCKLDPSWDNETKCRVTTVMHAYKEDNGLEMSCTFQYKNVTDYLIMYPKVKALCKHLNHVHFQWYTCTRFLIYMFTFNDIYI
ncbi:uncharacterized protein LOC132756943 [Ruditapes philippinarum]|uniref:uncharacterized protein LOC132756943 n=1 Tax=Ruditapes philippinarum TaxID=129788 RepID=UPI00295C21E5|nr:uncharacterized protein LOC132756943 [Ruditapes philippinarum]